MLLAPLVLVLVVVGAVVLLRRRRGVEGLPAAVLLLRVGFGIVAVETLFVGAFIAGETLTDPGGLAAVGWIAVWLVPLVGLGVVVKLAPGLALRLLTAGVGVMVAVGLWYAVSPDAWRDFEDDHGPVRTIATFALGSVLGLLGLWRTRQAGLLLLVLGLAPSFLAQLGTRPGGSSLLVAATTPVVVGVLYVLSSAVSRNEPVAPRGYGPG